MRGDFHGFSSLKIVALPRFPVGNGEGAKSPVSGTGCDSPGTAFRLRNVTSRTIGSDLVVEGDF